MSQILEAGFRHETYEAATGMACCGSEKLGGFEQVSSV